MRKSWLILILTIALAVTGCSSNSGNDNENSNTTATDKSAEQTGTATPEAAAASTDAAKIVPMLKIAGSDVGFPSPFTFSALGPFGFLRNSFLFDTLTWKDDSGVIPWLAKSWELSEDGLTYTFELEEQVKWHDGEAFTAEDVVFSFDYYKEHPFSWNGDISQIKSVEKINDLTVAFHLNNKYAPFLSDLVGIVPIIPQHIWQSVANPVEFQEDAALIGTGPYTLEEYDTASGQYLFAANDSYFKGEVLVKEVAYVKVADKLLALQNGEIDQTFVLTHSDVQSAEAAGFQSMKSDPTGSVVRITFNLDHAQLGDKRLRQAIAYALNREELAAKLTGGEPIVGSGGVIPPDSPWYNQDIKAYAYDKAEAERLLDELGYAKNSEGVRSGLKLSVMTSSNSPEATMMKEMLKEVGIDLTIAQVDGAAFSDAMGENKYDMAITGHIGVSGDPDFLRLWFSGQAANTYAARGTVFDAQGFQALAAEQMQELDETKRHAIVDQMQSILAEELPTLVLFHRPFYSIHNANVFDGWKNTYGGIADGLPLWENKALLIDVGK
ncbi:ABC transporter substrate-binding protein [Paenibacillus sp. 598K]|uniref:ABC transporter substrate-binding protein n=1 Tax=Paenibacillus sp. 598K TaxID=1117987 RepID=UPI000FF9D5B6|nr:ABC transporter substrate-binding protein [Paenibacillus sp. 598K]GBF76960.1 ABC transporter substrate-binding protein [Paenibacillus sp. 598K]